jgi:hypothetical protein
VSIGLQLLPVGGRFGFVTPPPMIFVCFIPMTVARPALADVTKTLRRRLAARPR